MYQSIKPAYRFSGLLACFLLFSLPVFSQENTGIDVDNDKTSKTLNTLESFVILRNNQQRDIKALHEQIEDTQSSTEKKVLNQQLNALQTELRATKRNFRDIAAGIDISILREQEEQAFNFQEEISALLKPAFDEMKEMTAHVRQKSVLKEKITYYQERLPVLEKALSNVKQLQENNQKKLLADVFDPALLSWEQKQSYMQSELKAAQLQLDKLLAQETSIVESSQSYLKSFFQKRGLYLIEAVLVILAIFLLSKLSYTAMQHFIPGFRAEHRSFRVRLVELTHRILTIFFVIIGPVIVFYLVEDWVLFSLGLLLLFGILWTLRQTMPRYWQQIHLFLNIGSVRENERIFLDGLPWKVQQINFFCKLTNPMAELNLRVPLNDMVELTSRPFSASEPWFPCKKDDWVILSDGVRGKVTGISLEMIELVERGGARITYQTSDFLANSPRNLATNFRIKETLGISYSLQQESTVSIPEILRQFIQQKIKQEGYEPQLLNLKVEFELANSSSLDLVIIADFKGELGDLYNRLRRAIQRWCVEACSENNWDIPFPQLSLHGALELANEKNNDC